MVGIFSGKFFGESTQAKEDKKIDQKIKAPATPEEKARLARIAVKFCWFDTHKNIVFSGSGGKLFATTILCRKDLSYEEKEDSSKINEQKAKKERAIDYLAKCLMGTTEDKQKGLLEALRDLGIKLASWELLPLAVGLNAKVNGGNALGILNRYYIEEYHDNKDPDPDTLTTEEYNFISYMEAKQGKHDPIRRASAERYAEGKLQEESNQQAQEELEAKASDASSTKKGGGKLSDFLKRLSFSRKESKASDAAVTPLPTGDNGDKDNTNTTAGEGATKGRTRDANQRKNSMGGRAA